MGCMTGPSILTTGATTGAISDFSRCSHGFQTQRRWRPARVVLADDHREMQMRVTALLASEFNVVAAVGDGEALVDAEADLRARRPRDRHHHARNQRTGSGSAGAAARFPSSDRFPVGPRGAGIRAGGPTGRARWATSTKVRLASDLIPAVRAALDGRRFVSASVDIGVDEVL